jgi:hypothetical protein
MLAAETWPSTANVSPYLLLNILGERWRVHHTPVHGALPCEQKFPIYVVRVVPVPLRERMVGKSRNVVRPADVCEITLLPPEWR